jgi:hypothetical protein
VTPPRFSAGYGTAGCGALCRSLPNNIVVADAVIVEMLLMHPCRACVMAVRSLTLDFLLPIRKVIAITVTLSLQRRHYDSGSAPHIDG